MDDRSINGISTVECDRVIFTDTTQILFISCRLLLAEHDILSKQTSGHLDSMYRIRVAHLFMNMAPACSFFNRSFPTPCVAGRGESSQKYDHHSVSLHYGCQCLTLLPEMCVQALLNTVTKAKWCQRITQQCTCRKTWWKRHCIMRREFSG